MERLGWVKVATERWWGPWLVGANERTCKHRSYVAFNSRAWIICTSRTSTPRLLLRGGDPRLVAANKRASFQIRSLYILQHHRRAPTKKILQHRPIASRSHNQATRATRKKRDGGSGRGLVLRRHRPRDPATLGGRGRPLPICRNLQAVVPPHSRGVLPSPSLLASSHVIDVSLGVLLLGKSYA
jgi:hypothetical protein